MERVHLGRSGLSVSRLCLGAMNFGTPGWGCDRAEAAAIVKTYRDAGGDFFDTADVYGGGASEEILGDLLRGSRDDVVIATKVGMSTEPGAHRAGVSAKHIRTAVEGSLRRLGTDYIDLYQVHHYDPQVPIDETIGVLDDLVRSGLVRYVGCSNYFAWQLAEAVGCSTASGRSQFVSIQMMYNLIRRDIEDAHVACARRFGVGLTTYGPLHAGMLAAGWTDRSQIPATSRIGQFPEVYLGDETRSFAITGALVEVAQEVGSTPGQLALAWVLANRDISCVLTAAQTADELDAQLVALDLDVPPDAKRRLDEVSVQPTRYPRDFYGRNDDREAARRAS